MREKDNLQVVLKVVKEEFRSDRQEVAALKYEFNVGKDLKHPNVIRMYDFGMQRDIPYLAMEFFATMNWKQFLREKPDHAAYFAGKMTEHAARGLECLHGHGWIHRDVKPDNFLVDSQGEVRLIDFSIASRESNWLSKLIPGKSKIQGTRSYISPEQIRGERVTSQADVYSFGCTLFELISGRLPFTAGSADELLNRHLKTAAPRLESANENVTPEFSGLVGNLMAKKPADRPNLPQFLEDLAKMRIFQIRPTNPEDVKGQGG